MILVRCLPVYIYRIYGKQLPMMPWLLMAAGWVECNRETVRVSRGNRADFSIEKKNTFNSKWKDTNKKIEFVEIPGK